MALRTLKGEIKGVGECHCLVTGGKGTGKTVSPDDRQNLNTFKCICNQRLYVNLYFSPRGEVLN